MSYIIIEIVGSVCYHKWGYVYFCQIVCYDDVRTSLIHYYNTSAGLFAMLMYGLCESSNEYISVAFFRGTKEVAGSLF